MPRTVIYPHKSEHISWDESERSIDEKAIHPKTTKSTTTTDPGDSYADKLAKFIPGEIVAFFAPLAALVAEKTTLLIAAGIIGLVATPAYLWTTARNLEEEKKPRWHFYILSSIAFVVWALATSSIGILFKLDSIECSFALAVTVFLVPLVDTLLTPKVGK